LHSATLIKAKNKAYTPTTAMAQVEAKPQVVKKRFWASFLAKHQSVINRQSTELHFRTSVRLTRHKDEQGNDKDSGDDNAVTS